MRELRTNTATRVAVGPFLDPTDGVTPKTALTVTNCHLTLIVDVAGVPTLVLDADATASGGANDMIHISGDDAGMYDLELAAVNVNYLGRAVLLITDASHHGPVWHEFMIKPAMIYDSQVLGTDRLDVNVTHIADTAQTAGIDLGGVLPDSVAADGSRPTIAQALLEITSFLFEASVSGATLTIAKEDGATPRMVFTLNSGTAPSIISRTA